MLLVTAIGQPRKSDVRKTESKVRAYERIGEFVQHSTGNVVLDEHYGFPLKYHGILGASVWPSAADLTADRLAGRPTVGAADRYRANYEPAAPRFFIVTDFASLNSERGLREFLTGRFRLAAEERDFLIYDLRSPPPGIEPGGNR
jgi:hypothetical protein